MLQKHHLIFVTIIILGFIDWLTTITGVFFYGATELNPILASPAQTNIILFSAIKLVAVTLTGLAFCKAIWLSRQGGSDWNFTKRFLSGSYSATFIMLTVVVGSNIVAIFS